MCTYVCLSIHLNVCVRHRCACVFVHMFVRVYVNVWVCLCFVSKIEITVVSNIAAYQDIAYNSIIQKLLHIFCNCRI